MIEMEAIRNGEVMSEWVEKRLGDVCEIVDGDRGANYPSKNELTPEGFCLFLNTGNVTKMGFKFDNNQYISRKKDDLLRKGKLQIDDIVLTTRGTVGNVAFYTSKVPFENVRINSGMVLLRAKDGYIPKYLYSFFRSYTMQKSIEMYSSGSAQPQLPIKDMRKIKIVIPSLPTQTRIADILAAYDDTIENNNRRIALLEKAARELYREWFVRFRFPGYEGVKIVNGLPEGWEVKRLGEVIYFSNGKTRPESIGNIPVYGGNGILSFCDASNQENGIIIGRVGAYCGSVFYERGLHWVSDNAIAAKNKENCFMDFAFHLLIQLNLNQRQTGTGQPLLTQDLLSKIKIVLPPYGLMRSFSDSASNSKILGDNIQAQSQNLARQRDFLLQRLMSGKLEV